MDEAKEWKKLKGKIYKSDCQVNKCTCGEISTQMVFYAFKEGETQKKHIKPIKRVAMAMCKCGNIFMAIPPEDLPI